MCFRRLTFAGTRFFATLVWPRGVKLPPSVSRLLWYLGKIFQRLSPYFQGPGIQWSYSLYCVMQAKVRNPRWQLTNRNTYISACTQRSDKIPTAISMFSESRNSMKLFLILCLCKRKSEIQDGGSQTEILISQLVHNVATKFQRLYPCFQGL